MSWILIFIGCTTMAAGYVYFISPYNIVPGGVYGASIVLHNIFPSVQVGTFGYMFDIPLLIIAVIIFGSHFGSRTIVAALYTPGAMNIISRLSYPNEDALHRLDPSQLVGGMLDLSEHLMLTTIIGGVIIGVGVGLVVRQQATTGGTDIVAMILQKYCHIKFSNSVLIADSAVVISGLIVIGFGVGTGQPAASGWLLSLYSLIAIYVSSRVLAYVIAGASNNKLLFIISEKHNDKLKDFILKDLDRTATYIKAKGMYTDNDKEMTFLVVPSREVVPVQRIIKEYDPTVFLVITDAYDTFGEGFKPLPEKTEIQNF
ncbi:MAG: YitT family protein [Alistipes sp.]